MKKLLIFLSLSTFMISCNEDLKSTKENSHKTHDKHEHKHAKNCGHKAVKHGDHIDYIHDGHYHAVHEGHVDEHGVVGGAREVASIGEIESIDFPHIHSKDCGHKFIEHDDHIDYILDDGSYDHVKKYN